MIAWITCGVLGVLLAISLFEHVKARRDRVTVENMKEWIHARDVVAAAARKAYEEKRAEADREVASVKAELTQRDEYHKKMRRELNKAKSMIADYERREKDLREILSRKVGRSPNNNCIAIGSEALPGYVGYASVIGEER